MAKLSLYIDPRGKTALHRTGFSWLAAFALPLWALHRRMRLTFLAVLPGTLAVHHLANMAIELAPDGTWQGALALAWLLGWSTAIGAVANRWHRHGLERAGYRMTATELPPDAAAAPRSMAAA